MGMESVSGIVNLLRFFVESERYSVVDKFANALSPETVSQALYEALRIARTLEKQEVVVTIKDERTGKTYTIPCWEIGRVSAPGRYPGMVGKLVEVLKGDVRIEPGATVYCVRRGEIPSEDEVNRLLSHEDPVKLAKLIAIQAYAETSRRRGEGE
ncbi:MAG: hypothetical protein QXW56_09985 [Nitrososphaerota archaeon]